MGLSIRLVMEMIHQYEEKIDTQYHMSLKHLKLIGLGCKMPYLKQTPNNYITF